MDTAFNAPALSVKVPHAPPRLVDEPARPQRFSADEQAKHNRIVAHFAPNADGQEYTLDDRPLDDSEKFWLTEECLHRYLHASDGNEEISKTRLEATLRWRREYGFGTDKMSGAALSIEGETGKEMIFGYDNARRPGLYMWPSRENTWNDEGRMRYHCFMMENVIALMDAGVESVSLFINFADRSENPSMSTARTLLNLMQLHYPERLGAAYISNVPFLVNVFFKAVMPFVDHKGNLTKRRTTPDTYKRTKLHFNPKMVESGLIRPEELMNMSGWGGSTEFEYEHAIYWPELLTLCGERRERELVEWRKMGAKIGASEWQIKSAAHGQAQPPKDV